VLIFPWIIGLLLLALIAELILVAPEVGRTFYRERRFSAHRPRMRAVAFLTVVELALVLAWALYVIAER
jgi:hypothetical protein